MIRTGKPDPAARLVRDLLRSLRDLNLTGRRIAVSGGEAVLVDGCLSVDGPVERGLRYRLREAGGLERVLHLAQVAEGLELRLRGPGAERRVVVALELDERGRATSPDLAARLDAGKNDQRAYEHFLRRVVRRVYSA